MGKQKPATKSELTVASRLYADGATNTQIKTVMRINHRRLVRILNQLELPMRPRGFLSEEGRKLRSLVGRKLKGRTRTKAQRQRMSRAQVKAQRRKKGWAVDSLGYIRLTRRGPNRDRHLHRVIAEMVLGRKLLHHEHVHHVDGDRANNNVNNLQVMTNAEHAALHGEILKWRKRG